MMEKATENYSKTTLGFWIYLMTDCLLFGSLFATFLVLRDSTYGGPAGKDLFDMSFVLLETLILLVSSFTCGLAIIAARRSKSTRLPMIFLAITFLLGAAFLALELTEFSNLVSDGHSWQNSAFLSAFFTLVGTHGLHITVGLIWALVLGWQLVKHGLTQGTIRRLTLFSMFWHFLDVIWIFVFSIVYLMGAA